jgi:hypothetical protein
LSAPTPGRDSGYGRRATVGNTDFDGADIVRACIRKRGYPTEKVARLAVAAIRRAQPDADVRVYGCRQCGLLHVGGSPGAQTRDAGLHGPADLPRRKNRRKAAAGAVYRGRERRHEVLSDRVDEDGKPSHRAQRGRYDDEGYRAMR